MSRPEHAPEGNPCAKCGKHPLRHRWRKRVRTQYWTEREWYRERDTPKKIDKIIGVDGEGQGRNEPGPDFPPHPYRAHRYTYLAAGDEKGRVWDVDNPDGLTTKQCFDMLLKLPADTLVVAYADMYDLTKILTDLPDDDIYNLFHEKEREYRVGKRVVYYPIEWEGYSINFMNRRFTLARGKRSITIWDIFRFFQGPFTQALIDWKIGDKEAIEAMAEMKQKRSNFDQLSPQKVWKYCQDECHHLAKLARALINAHNEAGLTLKHYYGAGSTASAFLDKVNIKDSRGIGNIPVDMETPIACAFFGGRFENSVFGPVNGRVYNYDISSAYPYQATFLPCLEHGKWQQVRKPKEQDIRNATLALVHWTVKPTHVESGAWGPFPVRHDKGTIAFPLGGRGGWVWRDEYLAGRRIAPYVKTDEAWLYHTDCTCQPFKDIPRYYIERLKLGKDAKGIVIKLGLNSIYGKLAQSVGLNPPYQSWIWAGNITSGTRAQLLDCIFVSADPWQVLMLATDGVFSSDSLTLPQPRDTGTGDTRNEKGELKPLGGWEKKQLDTGIFAVRPGIYFPQNPTKDQLKEVRARGLGKRILYESWQSIVGAYERGDEKVTVGTVVRFMGAKTSLTRGSKSGTKRSVNYGEWIPYPIQVGFSPHPKRDKVLKDGRLQPWTYLDWESVPYDDALMGPESEAYDIISDVLTEQGGELCDA